MRKKFLITITFLFLGGSSIYASKELLNVSYDPTRELYADYNKVFAKHWKDMTGEEITIATSHGGSGSQSRLIQDGGEARCFSVLISILQPYLFFL